MLFVLIYILQVVRYMRNMPELSTDDYVRVTMTIFHPIDINGSKSIIHEGSFVVITDGKMDLKLNDRIQVNGKIAKKVTRFFYTEYTLIYPSISNLSANIERSKDFKLNPNYLVQYCLELQAFLSKKLQLYLPEPHGSLVAGIILGSSASIPDNFYNNLIRTGTLHVIAASGYNITVIARLVMSGLTRVFRRRMAILASFLVMVIYALIAGGNPPVIRAMLMAFVTYMAQYWGRENMPGWTLVLSSGLMLLVWPELLVDVSFILSVTATAGILWLSEPIQGLVEAEEGSLQQQARESSFVGKNLRRKPGCDGLEEGVMMASLKLDVVTTTAAWIATLPIILIVFERVSLVALVVNTMVLWLVPQIMGLGMILLVVALFIPGLAGVTSWLVWLPTDVFTRVVEWFGRLEFASVEVAGLGEQIGYVGETVCVLVYYAVLTFVVFHWHVVGKNRQKGSK